MKYNPKPNGPDLIHRQYNQRQHFPKSPISHTHTQSFPKEDSITFILYPNNIWPIQGITKSKLQNATHRQTNLKILKISISTKAQHPFINIQ
jgi:hypothetical protein